MGIVMDTGEIVNNLDTVTTPHELMETFDISRGQLRNAMMKDRFEWVQIGRTIIIDRESFLDWWMPRDPKGLDIWFVMK
jgi:hypothetical protein